MSSSVMSQRRCCGSLHDPRKVNPDERSKKKIIQRRKREGSQIVADDNSLALDLSRLGDSDTLPQPRKSPRLNTTAPESSSRSSKFEKKSFNLGTSEKRPISAKVIQRKESPARKTTVLRPHSSVSKANKATEDVDEVEAYERPGTAPLIKVTEAFPVWSETELLEAIEKTTLSEHEDDVKSIVSTTDASYISTQQSCIHQEDENIEKDEEEDEKHPLKDQIQEITQSTIADEKEYDTDLEDDFPSGPIKEYDSTGRTIYLEQCQAEGVDPISFVLRNFHKPKLRLRHRYMAARDIKPLAQALGSNSCIEDLDLNDNHLTDEGALAIAVMMRNNNYIHKLNLSDNVIGRKGAAAMTFMLESNYTLKKLCLSGNHLKDLDAAILANGLRNNGTLTELDLSYNEFGEAGGVNLGLALLPSCILRLALTSDGVYSPEAANDGLVYLDLRWNSLRGKGVVAIANALKVNTSLEVLDLSRNAVALPGCMAFMRSLKVNTGLRVLNLNHNHVNTQATQKLSLGLKKNTKLEVLMLNCNPIGDEGVVALLKALMVNTSLKLLGIMDYAVSKEVKLNLKEIQDDRDVCILCRDPQQTKHDDKDSVITVSVVNQFITKNQTQVIDKCYAMDEERKGFISSNQLITTLLDAGIDVRKCELLKVMKILQIEDSQKISYRHLLKGLSALCQGSYGAT